MKIDLTKYSCSELEITCEIEIPLELKKELREVARKAEQLEDGDGIFFHHDYMRSKTKHHLYVSVEQLTEREQPALLGINYVVVDPGKINKTKYTPEFLISKITKKDRIPFECKCEFNLQGVTVADPLSLLPLKLSSSGGQLEVVCKGVYVTLLVVSPDDFAG